MNRSTRVFVFLCFAVFIVVSLIVAEVVRKYGWLVGTLVPAYIIICIRIIFYGVGDRDEHGKKSKRMGNDEDK